MMMSSNPATDGDAVVGNVADDPEAKVAIPNASVRLRPPFNSKASSEFMEQTQCSSESELFAGNGGEDSQPSLHVRRLANDDDGDGEGIELGLSSMSTAAGWWNWILWRRQGTSFAAGDSSPRRYAFDIVQETHDKERRRKRCLWLSLLLVAAALFLIVVATAGSCGGGRCQPSTGPTLPSDSLSNEAYPDGQSPPGAANNDTSTDNNDVNSTDSTADFEPSASPIVGTTAPSAATSATLSPVAASVAPVPPPVSRPYRTPEPTWAPHSAPLSPTTPLYCYPDSTQRQQWNDVWGQCIVQVKSEPSGGSCGPGNNIFTTNTVSYDATTDELTLEYKLVNGQWQASEVRLVLPDDLMPFTYGTYSFSVKNVATIDSTTGQELYPYLSTDLVIGLFTWDGTEMYEVHENYNHEVDVELSRWGDPSNADAQFLIQPPEPMQTHRFFSGQSSSGGDSSSTSSNNGTTSPQFNPGGHTYEFTWQPTVVSWRSSNGQSFRYTTRMALDANLPDRIQCLPANVEIRFNIWNWQGDPFVAPAQYSDNHMARVVIDNFSFVPSSVSFVEDGNDCSKHCQCRSTSRCFNTVCTAL